MLPELHSRVAALGPRFALPLEALTAIRVQHGSARMLEHALAHPVDDETTRLVALMLEDAKLALALMVDLFRAQASGKTAKVARVRKRLDRVLEAAQARARATCGG